MNPNHTEDKGKADGSLKGIGCSCGKLWLNRTEVPPHEHSSPTEPKPDTQSTEDLQDELTEQREKDTRNRLRRLLGKSAEIVEAIDKEQPND